MRKITYLLMVLAVAFIAVSCEKEPLQQFNESRSQKDVVPEAEDAVLEQLYGLWTRVSESEGSYKSMWEWRFYEDGYSLRHIETYEGDRLMGLNGGRIDYKLEN